MMLGDYFRSRASMAAQINTQAATIADLTDDLTIANGQVKARDGEIDGLKLILRQVEGERDTAFQCRNVLAARVAKLSAQLAPFIARNRDPVTKRFVSTTSAGEAAHVG